MDLLSETIEFALNVSVTQSIGHWKGSNLQPPVLETKMLQQQDL